MYRVIPQSNFFADILITCTMRTSDSGNLSNIDWKAIAGNLKKKNNEKMFNPCPRLRQNNQKATNYY